MFSLTNKVAVITGGGSGIGRSIAELFASQGADVVIFDLGKEGAENTVNAIKEKNGKASYHIVNVAEPESVINATNAVIAEKGAINILVNSAGISHIGKLESTNPDDFDRLFNVNVKGYYNTMKTIVDKMVSNGGGVILNICSVAASIGIPDRFAYSMSKGAVKAMTLSVARDYVEKGIRVNCISPGRVHTPFVDSFLQKNYPGQEKEMFEKLSKTQPIGRMGTPNEMGFLALYLCSDEAGFITGSDYLIDGGFVNLK